MEFKGFVSLTSLLPILAPASEHLLTPASAHSVCSAVLGLCLSCEAASERKTEAAVTGIAWPAFLHLGTALLQEHFLSAPHTDSDAAFIFPLRNKNTLIFLFLCLGNTLVNCLLATNLTMCFHGTKSGKLQGNIFNLG